MDTIQQDAPKKPFALVGTVAIVSIIFFVGQIVHRLYFHRLHHIPGPKLNAISRVPYIRHSLGGTTAKNVKILHDQYGEVVRTSPNEISFSSGESAWPDIYGFRIGKMSGHANMGKDRAWYAPPIGAPNIINANDEDHSRYRKQLSHAFSERALASQEVLLQKYADLLIDGLKKTTATDKAPRDMTVWYNWFTFDVITDLLFGEPFGCLDNLKTHQYVSFLLLSFESIRFMYIFHHWPLAAYVGRLFGSVDVLARRKAFHKWAREHVEERVSRETDRPDFFTEILKHQGQKGADLTIAEMTSNATVMLIAGSETTATLLSGATWLLMKNPRVLQKLKDEVRGRWKTAEEITLAEVMTTPYLIAVLQEALRCYPPVPTGFLRMVGKGGEVISGHFIPEGTSVGVSSYAVGHSERNFKNPESFVPERWMGDKEYEDDLRSAHQPFSFGPRNCIGKNLAYAEMRLVLARLVWSFDMELDPKSENWMDENRVKVLWKKPELAVHFKEVVRD